MPTFSKSQTQNLSGHGRTTSVATIPSTQSPTQRTCLVRSFFREPSAIRRIADRSKAKHGGEQATGASWPKIGGTTANVDTAPTSLAIRARPKGGAEGTAPSGLDLSGRRSSRVPAPRTELYGGACTDARRIGIVTGPAQPALPRCRRAAVAVAGWRRPVHADPFPPYRGWPFRSRLRRVGSPVLLSRVAVRPFVGRALRIGTRRRHLRARGVGRQRLRVSHRSGGATPWYGADGDRARRRHRLRGNSICSASRDEWLRQGRDRALSRPARVVARGRGCNRQLRRRRRHDGVGAGRHGAWHLGRGNRQRCP